MDKSRRAILQAMGIGAASLMIPGCATTEKQESRLPNVVIIFTDDQGYADVGCYGAEGFTTPNMDQLALDGVRFTDFHVSEAVCSAPELHCSPAVMPKGSVSGEPWGHGTKMALIPKRKPLQNC